MISDIALFLVLGLPLIFYGGVLTLLLFLIAAYIGYRIRKGTYPMTKLSVHYMLAGLAILFALLHMILGMAFIFNF